MVAELRRIISGNGATEAITPPTPREMAALAMSQSVFPQILDKLKTDFAEKNPGLMITVFKNRNLMQTRKIGCRFSDVDHAVHEYINRYSITGFTAREDSEYAVFLWGEDWRFQRGFAVEMDASGVARIVGKDTKVLTKPQWQKNEDAQRSAVEGAFNNPYSVEEISTRILCLGYHHTPSRK